MYAKAIAAFLTGAVGVAAMFIPGVTDVVTPEIIAAITTLVSAFLDLRPELRETMAAHAE